MTTINNNSVESINSALLRVSREKGSAVQSPQTVQKIQNINKTVEVVKLSTGETVDIKGMQNTIRALETALQTSNKTIQTLSQSVKTLKGQLENINVNVQGGKIVYTDYNDVDSESTITAEADAPHYLGKYTEAEKPDITTTIEGDWYFNTDDVKLYKNESGEWVEVVYSAENAYMFNAASTDLLNYAENQGQVGFYCAAFISNLSALKVLFKNYVASLPEVKRIGDKLISMGKNPVYDSDSSFNFRIQTYKGATDNGAEIWTKDLFSKLNSDNNTDLILKGKLESDFGLSTFGDVYSGCYFKPNTIDYNSTDGFSLAGFNAAVVFFNGYYYTFQGGSGYSIAVNKSEDCKMFTREYESGISGVVADAVVYKGEIYVSVYNSTYELYKYIPGTGFTYISNCHIELKVIDDLLYFVRNNRVCTYDGETVTELVYDGSYVTGYCISNFSDDLITTYSNPPLLSGSVIKTNGTLRFYTKNGKLIGSTELHGKQIKISDSENQSMNYVFPTYSANGILFSLNVDANGNTMLIRSLDSGNSWEKCNIELSWYVLGFRVFAYKSVIVINGESSIFYSSDNGKTWNYQNYDTPTTYYRTNCCVAEKGNTNEICIPSASSESGQARLRIDRLIQTKSDILEEENTENSHYIKLTNGLIIQWGIVRNAPHNTNYTVMLPISYSTTNYYVGLTCLRIEAQGYINAGLALRKELEPDRFVAGTYYNNFLWFTIGY